MDIFIRIINEYAPFLINKIYFILFAGGVLEGMNTFILAGFLSSFGKVDLVIVIPLLIVAHTLNGYMWYCVGYLGGAKALDRWGHKSKLSHEMINKISSFFERYSGRAIILSKFTFSFEIITMILSGSLKYDLKKFSRYNLVGSMGWVIMTVMIGHFFGKSYSYFFEKVKNLTLAILFLAIAIISLYLIAVLFKGYYAGYIEKSYNFKYWKDKINENIEKFFKDE